VRYCGAEPVFVDSDLTTWNLDPDDLRSKITPRTRAVVPVHLYGRPAAMAEILAIAGEAGLTVLEDAAEAVGAEVGGRKVGSLSTVAAFSFFGNKILTCGEGGMIVTADADLAAKIRQIKGQGQDPNRRYWFPIIGYNYRMTNIEAAIGLAQLERIDEHLAARDEIAAWYREELTGLPEISIPQGVPTDRSVCWLFSVVLQGEDPGLRDRVATYLSGSGIETRPFFYPCHLLPPYLGSAGGPSCPRAEWLGARGLSLPTWLGMERDQVRRVASSLSKALVSCVARPIGSTSSREFGRKS
jgi:perosamine synthetase